jgi:hypothetical protein
MYRNLAANGLDVAADGSVVSATGLPLEVLPVGNTQLLPQGAMATVPATDYVGAMQTVREGCPPCPEPVTKIVYRDRIVEKKVFVPVPVPGPAIPGPTKYVYITAPAGGAPPTQPFYGSPLPDSRGAAYSFGPSGSSSAGGSQETPVDGGSGAGSQQSAGESLSVGKGKFPWWLVAAAFGAAWMMSQQRGR